MSNHADYEVFSIQNLTLKQRANYKENEKNVEYTLMNKGIPLSVFEILLPDNDIQTTYGTNFRLNYDINITINEEDDTIELDNYDFEKYTFKRWVYESITNQNDKTKRYYNIQLNANITYYTSDSIIEVNLNNGCIYTFKIINNKYKLKTIKSGNNEYDFEYNGNKISSIKKIDEYVSIDYSANYVITISYSVNEICTKKVRIQYNQNKLITMVEYLVNISETNTSKIILTTFKRYENNTITFSNSNQEKLILNYNSDNKTELVEQNIGYGNFISNVSFNYEINRQTKVDYNDIESKTYVYDLDNHLINIYNSNNTMIYYRYDKDNNHIAVSKSINLYNFKNGIQYKLSSVESSKGYTKVYNKMFDDYSYLFTTNLVPVDVVITFKEEFNKKKYYTLFFACKGTLRNSFLLLNVKYLKEEQEVKEEEIKCFFDIEDIINMELLRCDEEYDTIQISFDSFLKTEVFTCLYDNILLNKSYYDDNGKVITSIVNGKENKVVYDIYNNIVNTQNKLVSFNDKSEVIYSIDEQNVCNIDDINGELHKQSIKSFNSNEEIYLGSYENTYFNEIKYSKNDYLTQEYGYDNKDRLVTKDYIDNHDSKNTQRFENKYINKNIDGYGSVKEILYNSSKISEFTYDDMYQITDINNYHFEYVNTLIKKVVFNNDLIYGADYDKLGRTTFETSYGLENKYNYEKELLKSISIGDAEFEYFYDDIIPNISKISNLQLKLGTKYEYDENYNLNYKINYDDKIEIGCLNDRKGLNTSVTTLEDIDNKTIFVNKYASNASYVESNTYMKLYNKYLTKGNVFVSFFIPRFTQVNDKKIDISSTLMNTYLGTYCIANENNGEETNSKYLIEYNIFAKNISKKFLSYNMFFGTEMNTGWSISFVFIDDNKFNGSLLKTNLKGLNAGYYGIAKDEDGYYFEYGTTKGSRINLTNSKIHHIVINYILTGYDAKFEIYADNQFQFSQDSRGNHELMGLSFNDDKKGNAPYISALIVNMCEYKSKDEIAELYSDLRKVFEKVRENLITSSTSYEFNNEYEYFPLNYGTGSTKNRLPFIEDEIYNEFGEIEDKYEYDDQTNEVCFKCKGNRLGYNFNNESLYSVEMDIMVKGISKLQVYIPILTLIDTNGNELKCRINFIGRKIQLTYKDKSVAKEYTFNLNTWYKIGISFRYTLRLNLLTLRINDESITTLSLFDKFTINKMYVGSGTIKQELNLYTIVNNLRMKVNSSSSLDLIETKTLKRYDEFNRLTDKEVMYNNNEVLKSDYEYKNNILFKERSSIYGDIEYQYDYMNNVTHMKSSNGEYTYSYDDKNQLISSAVKSNNANSNSTTYTYDEYGNITSIMYDNSSRLLFTYDDKNRLTNVGSASVLYYEEKPYLIKEINTRMTTEKLEYKDNNLSKYEQYSKINNSIKCNYFFYDNHGRRIKKIIKNETDNIEHDYYYDTNNKLIYEKRNDILIKYLYDENNELYGLNYNGKYYYYVKNAFQTILALVDEEHQLVEEYTYEAYGEVEIKQLKYEENINFILYKGYYYDIETGLYYVMSRYYQPHWGRWLTPDSINYLNPNSVNGLNLYCYCGNNPVNNYDPSGHFPLLALAALLLFTPIGGIATQIAVSTICYVGMAIVSIWDENIRADMNRIRWNPFNDNESKVSDSNRVSFYKGIPVFIVNGLNASFSFGIIGFDKNIHEDNENVLKHEFGHNIQLMIMGPANYGLFVGIPSPNKNGDNTPWELSASILGGSNLGEEIVSPEDRTNAMLYLACASLNNPILWAINLYFILNY